MAADGDRRTRSISHCRARSARFSARTERTWRGPMPPQGRTTDGRAQAPSSFLLLGWDRRLLGLGPLLGDLDGDGGGLRGRNALDPSLVVELGQGVVGAHAGVVDVLARQLDAQ